MKKLIILLFISAFIISCSDYGEKLEFKGTEVYYKDDVTKAEATKLGEYLISSEFADGRTKSVQLTKNEETDIYNFRMVTTPETAKDSTYEIVFKIFAKQISDSVLNGKPVDFHVCDNTFKTLKVIEYDKE